MHAFISGSWMRDLSLSLTHTRANSHTESKQRIQWKHARRVSSCQFKPGRLHNTREPQKIAARAETRSSENYKLLHLPFAGQRSKAQRTNRLVEIHNRSCKRVLLDFVCSSGSHLYTNFLCIRTVYLCLFPCICIYMYTHVCLLGWTTESAFKLVAHPAELPKPLGWLSLFHWLCFFLLPMEYMWERRENMKLIKKVSDTWISTDARSRARPRHDCLFRSFLLSSSLPASFEATRNLWWTVLE